MGNYMTFEYDEVSETEKALVLMGIFIISLLFILPLKSVMTNGVFDIWFIAYLCTVASSFLFIYLLAKFKCKKVKNKPKTCY